MSVMGMLRQFLLPVEFAIESALNDEESLRDDAPLHSFKTMAGGCARSGCLFIVRAVEAPRPDAGFGPTSPRDLHQEP